MSNISEIVNTIKDLISVRLEIIQEEVQRKISSLIIRLVILVFMGVITLFILFFGSLSLAFYLSELSHSVYMGFIYVTGIYIVLFFILYLVRNSLKFKSSLQNSVNRFIFSGNRKEENE